MHREGETERDLENLISLRALVIAAVALCLCGLAMGACGQPIDGNPSVLRTNLLIYQRTPQKLKPITSVEQWEKRRAQILLHAQEVMGPLPGSSKRCPLQPLVISNLDCGTFVQQTLSYESEPGSRVPAFLLIPKAALKSPQKYPSILALHPTDMEYGNRVVVEELRDYYRSYARDLAERGFVVLAPSYPLMAKYQPDLKALGYQSGTMKAIWDNIRGLDYLESLGYVEPGRFGAIGHSLGGHNAIYTALFDDRLKVIVTSCGFDSYRDYQNGDIRGWTSERYMPALLAYRENLDALPFDFYELLGSLAPRRVFINAPLRDNNFSYRSVDRIVSEATRVYWLYGRSKSLQVEHPDCGHDFPPEIREKAYRILKEELP